MTIQGRGGRAAGGRPFAHAVHVVLLALLLVACSSSPEAAPPPSASQPAADLLPWYQREARESQEMDDVLAELTLRVGYVDGTTTGTFDLPFNLRQDLPPIGLGFISGPAHGTVALSLDDGTRSRIQLIDVASGEAREIFETDDAIVAGAFHQRGDAIFVVLADRASRGGRLARLDLDADGAVANFTDLPWVGNPTIDRNEVFELLHFTPDGARLVIQRCRDNSCSYGVLALDGLAVTELRPRGTGGIVGMSDSVILTGPSTWQTTKEFFLIDLASGEIGPVDLEGQQATLVAGPTGPLVVLQEGELGGGGGGGGHYVVIDPATDARRPLAVPPNAWMGPLVPEPERQGLVPPAGWLVFADEGRIAIDGAMDPPPVLLEVTTGRSVELVNLR